MSEDIMEQWDKALDFFQKYEFNPREIHGYIRKLEAKIELLERPHCACPACVREHIESPFFFVEGQR